MLRSRYRRQGRQEFAPSMLQSRRCVCKAEDAVCDLSEPMVAHPRELLAVRVPAGPGSFRTQGRNHSDNECSPV